MQHPSLTLLVTREDESVDRGFSNTHIPTYGHIASTIDAYRTAGIHSVANRPLSWCLTDTDAEGALGRIVDGPIKGGSDIESAESALRALLLHEFVDVVIPCIKAEQENGFVHYVRLDKGQRNDAAFAAFQVAPCRDLLVATEYVSISNGMVSSSSYDLSPFAGKSVETLGDQYRSAMHSVSEIARSLPIELSATTHFSGPEFLPNTGAESAGFIDELYRRVYRPWTEIAQSAPLLYLDVKLPPLLAIVLSRAPTRETIPDVLRGLREELEPARAELCRLNGLLDSSLSQADIHAQVSKLNEAFDSIVPEALLTDAQKRLRRVKSVFKIFGPVHSLYSIAADPLNADRARFLEMFRQTQGAVAANSRLVTRSVAAAKLAELLQVGSVRESVLTHFTESEVRSIASRQDP